MKAERLRKFLENAVAFDCETHKIQPGLLAPPLVCASVARWNPTTGRSEGRLLDAEQARVVFRELLESDCTIVGANIAYDCGVMAADAAARGVDLMPLIFAAYEAGRIYDVQIAEALHAVAIGFLRKDPRTGAPLQDPITRKRGGYSLSIVLDLVLGRRDAKVNDLFRESYALLEGTPIAEWPPEARIYPIDDACNTFDSGAGQAGLIPRPCEHAWGSGGPGSEDRCRHCGVELGFGGEAACPPRPWANYNLHDLARQVYAAFAMHLGAIWGFTVDPEAVLARKAELEAQRKDELGTFVDLGFLRWKKQKGAKGCIACGGTGKVPGEFITKMLFGVATQEPVVCQQCHKASKHTAVIKRENALSYGCTGACPTCAGTQKVKSSKSGKPVGCRACDSTGLNLDSAPVPRTKGSKCRTCKSTREVGPGVTCTQCAGQPDVIPGCKTSRDALTESGAEDLINFAVHLENAKLLETYLPFLLKGISDVPDDDEDEESEDE